MKKQTQSKLVSYWSKLPDGSRIHGLGTYKPPPVTDYSKLTTITIAILGLLKVVL